MAFKFYGPQKELSDILDEIGIRGGWREGSENRLVFRFNNGAILNWWFHTGTINIQGPQEAKEYISLLIEPLLLRKS